MKNNLFPLWLSPVLMGTGTLLVYASNITISYTPPNASLNTLLTGELVVPAQMPIPGAEPIKLLGLGSIGLGLARLGGYAFGKKSETPDMAQLPPWQEARTVTPVAYATQPMKDARATELEEPIVPATHLEPPKSAPVVPVEVPRSVSEPAPQPPAVTAIEPEAIAPQPVPKTLAPAPAPVESAAPITAKTALPSPPNAPIEVVGQPSPSQDIETQLVAPDAETNPPVASSHPLGVVNRLVETVTHRSMPQHLAIAGIPRGGKSYTLRGIIWGIKQVEPEAIVRIVDLKNSPVGWLGLEKMPECVRLAHHGVQPALDTIDEAIALLDRAIDTRDTQQKAYFIFDDWSGLLAEAKRLDAKAATADPPGEPIYPDLIYNMERLALKGLEYGIHLILATHSWDCVEFGFDAQCRLAFAIAALGRQGRWETLASSIESAALIPDDAVRDRLTREKSAAIEKASDCQTPVLLLAGDRGTVDAIPDFEWLDWVDLSVFTDKLAPEADTCQRNGTAVQPLAEIA